MAGKLLRWPKKGQNGLFWPWRSEFDPIFTIFHKFLLNKKLGKIIHWENFCPKNCKNGNNKKVNFEPLFSRFFTNTSKKAQKHHIKKTEKLIHWEIFQVQKTAKIAENGMFFFPGGPYLDPFSQFFSNHF